MIHFRRTHPISPGRRSDAVLLAHEWVALWKDAGVDLRVSEVITGTLGRLCGSADFESMGAFEAARTRMEASPKAQAFAQSAIQSGCAFAFANAASCAPMLSVSADMHKRPSVPVVTTETRMVMPWSFAKSAHSCARATASPCLPGAMSIVFL